MSATLGDNYFQKADAGQKGRVRTFFQDLLGCEHQEINEGLDIFGFEDGRTYGVRYCAEGFLSDEQHQDGTWMSLDSPDRAALVKRLREFGVTEMPEQSDENNFFFQAPGGQVFAL